ncbi:MAG TPA: hypothetical protein VFO82_16745 [Steroidobacteraceae bacterium]|nr:hypothetical protein [Steroidobacteraceae bacterium]
MATVIRSRFYPLAAIVLATFIVASFARTYYLRFLFDQPPLKLLVHLHGLVFTAWLALFIVQTRLIAAHNYRLHMKVGIAGALLAVAVVTIGVLTALASAPVPRVRPMGMTGLQFLIVPLMGIIFFGVCVAAAVALRRRADLHKRLMLLGMFAVLGPAVARINRLVEFGDLFLLIQTSVVVGFVSWALLYDWFRNRIVHPVFVIGGCLLVVSWPVRAWIARTEGWHAVAQWLTT